MSKSMLGPFKGNAWDSSPRYTHLTQPPSLLVFAAKSYVDFSSWHWNPELGSLVWGLGLSLLMGDFHSQDISFDF